MSVLNVRVIQDKIVATPGNNVDVVMDIPVSPRTSKRSKFKTVAVLALGQDVTFDVLVLMPGPASDESASDDGFYPLEDFSNITASSNKVKHVTFNGDALPRLRVKVRTGATGPTKLFIWILGGEEQI